MDAFKLIVVSLAGWVNHQQQHVTEYLQEEVRVLKELNSSKFCALTRAHRCRRRR